MASWLAERGEVAGGARRRKLEDATMAARLGEWRRRGLEGEALARAAAEPLGATVDAACGACLRGAAEAAPAHATAQLRWAEFCYRAGMAPPAKGGGDDDAAAAAELAALRSAVRGYFRYLQLREEGADPLADEVAVPLRLLRLLLRHAATLGGEFDEALKKTPALAWRGVVPQLFARLAHPEPLVRAHVQALLVAIGRRLPELVLYPAIVGGGSDDDGDAAAGGASGGGDGSGGGAADGGEEGDDDDDDGDERKRQMRAICRSLATEGRGGVAALYAQLDTVIRELRRVTLLPEEHLAAGLQALQSDAHARVQTLNDEAARVGANDKLPADEKRRILREKYTAVMGPVLAELEAHAAALSAAPATPHEDSFARGALRELRRAISVFRQPLAANFAKCWAPLAALQRELSATLRAPRLSLDLISPRLARLRASAVPMPGLAAGVAPSEAEHDGVAGDEGGRVTLDRLGDAISVLPTKTKPKKLSLIGSDGREYAYLLKGRDDLHLDERIMQFLRVVNGTLRADRRTRAYPSLRARHYAVLPLGPRSGLIQWVQGATPLFALYKASQQRAHAAALLKEKGAKDGGAAGGDGGGGGGDGRRSERPSDLFYAKLMPALAARGISESAPRREWPHDVLRKVLGELTAAAPRDLLSHELWATSADSHAAFAKTQAFARSAAVMSMVGYVIGLGDRHLDNVLLDLRSAELLHIDYSVCFERGLRLKVPETVPFRLTHSMQAALGPAGADGAFASWSEATLRVLRRSRETLLTLLEAFVYDPLVDWESDRGREEQRKGAELSVGLQLAASRVDELRAPLAAWSEQLPSATIALSAAFAANFDAREAAGADDADAAARAAAVAAEQLIAACAARATAADEFVALESDGDGAAGRLAAARAEAEAARDRLALWHAQHEQSASLLRGGWLTQAAAALADAQTSRADRPPVVAALEGGRALVASLVSRELPQLSRLEHDAHAAEGETHAAAAHLLGALDDYAAAAAAALPAAHAAARRSPRRRSCSAAARRPPSTPRRLASAAAAPPRCWRPSTPPPSTPPSPAPSTPTPRTERLAARAAAIEAEVVALQAPGAAAAEQEAARTAVQGVRAHAESALAGTLRGELRRLLRRARRALAAAAAGARGGGRRRRRRGARAGDVRRARADRAARDGSGAPLAAVRARGRRRGRGGGAAGGGRPSRVC